MNPGLTVKAPFLAQIFSHPHEETRYSPHQTAKYLRDIGVVSSGFGDGDAQFSVAEGAQGSDAAPENPNHQRQTH